MKRIWKTGVMLAGLLFLLMPASLWGNDVPVIRVAAFNYYPAIFLDTNNQVQGFYVDMLNDIASHEQVRFEYVFGSWKDGLERLRSGEVDLVTSAAYTEERANFMDFGQQILLTVWGELYIHQGSQTIPISALQGQPIAVMQGDYNAQAFKEHLDKFGINSHFFEVADFDEVFAAVKNKQVSAGVVNSVFGDAAADKYQLQPSGIAFNPFNIYFATAKGQHAGLLRLLDEYLTTWRNDSASVYFQSRLKWGAVQDAEASIPAWIVKLAIAAALLLVIGLVFVVVLRYQVDQATRRLKKNEAELQKSNDMIRLLLDSTAEAIYGVDPQGLCIFCNAACVRILGYDNAEQLIGRNMHDLIHHSHADGTAMPATECQLLKVLEDQVHCDNDVFWRADGSSFAVEYWSYPIIQEGKNIGMVVSFVDITERKKAQGQQLLAQFSIEHTSEAVFWVDALGQVKLVNPAACQQLGYSRDELLNMSIADIDPDRSTEKWPEHFDQLRQHKHLMIETCHRTRNGDILHVEMSANYFKHQDMELNFASVRNVTKRKQAEEQLRASEQWHRTILRTALSGIWTVNLQGNFLEVNELYCALSGYSQSELKGMYIADVEGLESREDVHRHIQEIIRSGEARFESRHRRKDGTVYDVEVSAKYLPVDDGRIVAIINDISERKRVEVKLLRNKHALEKSQEIGVIGTWELDIVNDELYWTDENCRIFGVPSGSIVNFEVFIDKVHPDDRDYVGREWQAALEGKPYDLEHRVLIDGKIKWVRERAHISYDGQGKAVNAIGVTQDITDRKQLMDDYRRSAQLAALGTVAAGVAHEINNPIQGIINYATLIGDAPERTERIVQMSGRIIKEGNRIASITRDLLHYAKDSRGQFRVTDILEPIKAAVSLLNLNYKHSGVSIDLDLPASPVSVMANPQWIQQVIINLVENAFDAIQEKGDVREGEVVEVTGRVLDDGGSQKFRMEILDHGIGIPADILGRVRDAFFTTKQETKGTGLGLSIVADIVAKHQGALEIESAEGDYTRITVILPLAK